LSSWSLKRLNPYNSHIFCDPFMEVKTGSRHAVKLEPIK
jgi:hypothetical protein